MLRLTLLLLSVVSITAIDFQLQHADLANHARKCRYILSDIDCSGVTSVVAAIPLDMENTTYTPVDGWNDTTLWRPRIKTTGKTIHTINYTSVLPQNSLTFDIVSYTLYHGHELHGVFVSCDGTWIWKNDEDDHKIDWSLGEAMGILAMVIWGFVSMYLCYQYFKRQRHPIIYHEHQEPHVVDV